MLDFRKQMRINGEADEIVKDILAKREYTVDQNKVISAIEDLAVAKEVIRRLLDKVNVLDNSLDNKIRSCEEMSKKESVRAKDGFFDRCER